MFEHIIHKQQVKERKREVKMEKKVNEENAELVHFRTPEMKEVMCQGEKRRIK